MTPLRIFDPISRSIESVAERLEWSPQKDSKIPEKIEEVIRAYFGENYNPSLQRSDNSEVDFCWTGSACAPKSWDDGAVDLMSQILRSTPPEQLQHIEHIKTSCTASDLLNAADTIDTGSARMMAASLITNMSDAWAAWRIISQRDFGDTAISYLGDIIDTPEQKTNERSEVLMELVRNHTDEVKESLIDEIAARDALAAHTELLELLKSDDSEVIRDYAQALG